MDKIIQQYGNVAKVIVVALALVGIIYNVKDSKDNTGVKEIISENTNVDTVDYENRHDTDATLAKSNRTAPVFEVKNLHEIKSQASVDLFNYITCTNQDGNSLKVTIKSIQNSNNEEMIGELVDGRYFTFPRSGSYKLKLYAIDSENASKVQVINLSINRGGKK